MHSITTPASDLFHGQRKQITSESKRLEEGKLHSFVFAMNYYLTESFFVFRCWSDVGMIGLRQTLSLDDRCILASIPGLIVHELMHTLGFYHEHQRPDRDEFVSIDLNNVEPSKQLHHQFIINIIVHNLFSFFLRTENRGYFQKMSEWDFLTRKFSYDYGIMVKSCSEKRF